MEIFDVHNVTNTISVSRFYTTGQAWKIRFWNDYLLLADGWTGVRIFDVSHRDPELVGRYGGNFMFGRDVQVRNNIAYMAAETDGLHVVDLSNPRNPTKVGHLPYRDNIGGIDLVGDYVYLAESVSGLQIVSITNPVAPVRLGNVAYTNEGNAISVAVANNVAYVAYSSAGLQIFDVANPMAPRKIGSYTNGGSAFDIKVVGNRAYLGAQGFYILDISNPANPSLIGSAPVSGSIALKDDLAFVQGSTLSVIDLADPSAPVVLDTVRQYGWGINQKGGRVYVAAGDDGVQVYDLVKHPRLFIDRQGSSMRISWDPPISGMLLEQTEESGPYSFWIPVSGGEAPPVSVSTGAACQMFRLRRN